MPFNVNSNTSATISRHNASSALLNTKKSIERLSTGKKIISSADDAASLVISDKLSGKINNLSKHKENLQNSISFLQIQSGAIRTAGEMISRASELKHKFHDSIKNSHDKANYDEEFKEIQLQLRELQQQKFNGISLFANGNINSLASSSQHSSILNVEHLGQGKKIEIHRTGIFDSLFIEKEPKEKVIPLQEVAGNGNETKISVPLTAISGNIEWNILSGFNGDRFTIEHGTDTLLDEIYGRPLFGPSPTINFGDGFNGNATSMDHRFSQDLATGAPITFPLTPNNNATELVFYVNKGNQAASGTAWTADIKVSFQKTQMSLTDGNLYSLNDFEFSEFNGFINVISDALAQNGATQARIRYDSESLSFSHLNLNSAQGRISDADYAKESLNLAKNKILTQTSASMIGKSNQLTKLAITIMGI